MTSDRPERTQEPWVAEELAATRNYTAKLEKIASNMDAAAYRLKRSVADLESRVFDAVAEAVRRGASFDEIAIRAGYTRGELEQLSPRRKAVIGVVGASGPSGVDHRAATLNGLAAARARGVVGGNRTVWVNGREEQAKLLLAQGISPTTVSAEVGVSRSAIYRFMADHGIPRQACGARRQAGRASDE